MRGRHQGGEEVEQLRLRQRQRATAAEAPLRVVVGEALRSDFRAAVEPINRMFFGVISCAAVFGPLLAAPAVGERDRDCTLGSIMPHDVPVELLDDFLEGSSETKRRTFSPNDTAAQ